MRHYSPCRIFHDNSLLLNFFLPKFVTKILGEKKKKKLLVIIFIKELHFIINFLLLKLNEKVKHINH